MKKKRTFYEKIYDTFSGIVNLVFRITVKNADRIPEEGACILCANHTSMMDVLVISAAMKKRQVRYMAKKELFSIPLLAPLIKALGAFPVDRGGNDVTSIRTTISLLSQGEMIGIFPQGTRYPGVDPRSTEVKHGIGMIAYRANANVLPVYIQTAKRKTKFFRKTEVIIGNCIQYEALGFESGGTQEYRRVSENIFDQICRLGEEGENA